jgi:hypothetical protein
MSCAGGAIAVFNYTNWIGRFPEFQSTVTQQQAEELFVEAGMNLANDGSGPVGNPAQQLILLNLVVAHLAQIYFGSSLQPVNNAVGRVTSAGQGSVNVSLSMDGAQPGSKDWYLQTKYGAQFWKASQPFRLASYVPKFTRRMNPWGRGMW